ncbi:MAG: hypothetical protein FWH26_09010 [Oscillospiraceae bacterium]|nr:hypothetical protein [Oscillospiraceae bacterium]
MRNNQDHLNEIEMDDMIWLLDACLPSAPPGGIRSGITEKQLRALSRKHLLMMIYDLEKELALEKNRHRR